MHPNLGGDGLGDKQLVHESPPIEPPSGFLGARGSAVIDVDADGTAELLVSTVVGAFGHANPVEDLVLLRRVGTTWERG